VEHLEVVSGGVRLDVTVAGDPASPPLLLLHGWPESSLAFSKVAPLLEADYRLLIPDQRGFGFSDKPVGTDSYAMGSLVGDALAIADAAGAERVSVVGHDLGGSVAWALGAVAAHRVRAMVVMASPHPLHFRRVGAAGLEQTQRAFYVWLMQTTAGERLLGRDDFRPLARWVFGRSAVTEGERAAYRRQWSQPGTFTAMAEWYRANYTPDLLNPEVPLRLAPVTVPVRYLAPESDPAFAAGMEAGSGDFVEAAYDEMVVAGTSHWMCHDAPEAVAALITEWMRAHP
jgi:pimeloyl-ACP methyl ester carboxylesterase